MFDFKDQVVLITGAGSPNGMGRIFAADFAKLGAKVILVDIDQAGIDANVNELRDQGYQADGYEANLTDEDAVKFIAGLDKEKTIETVNMMKKDDK